MKGQDKEEWSRAPGSASWACDPYMQRALHSEEPHACFNVLCQCDGIRNECIREPGLHKSSATGPWSRPVSREDSATRLSPIPSLPHTYSCWPCHTSTESSGRAMRGNPAGLKVNVRSAPSVSDWIIRTLTAMRGHTFDWVRMCSELRKEQQYSKKPNNRGTSHKLFLSMPPFTIYAENDNIEGKKRDASGAHQRRPSSLEDFFYIF